MPYPLKTLGVDLTLRMRDLATPAQVHRIQVAVGDDRIAWGQPRLCKKIESLRLKRSLVVPDLRVFVHNATLTQIQIEKDYTYEVTDCLSIDCFRKGDSADWFFNYLVVNCSHLRVLQCELTVKELKKIALKFDKPITEFSQLYTKPGYFLKFRQVFYALPQIHSVYFGSLYPKWVKDVVLSKKTGLKSMHVCGDLWDFLDCKISDLVIFFDRQDPNFILDYCCTDAPSDFRNIPRTMLRYLEPHFNKRRPCQRGKLLRMWHQVKNEDYLDCVQSCFLWIPEK